MKFVENNKLGKKYITIVLIALGYWLFSFFLERKIFVVSNIKNRIFTYIMIKALVFIVLVLFLCLLYNFIQGFKNRNSTFYIFLYSIPFIIIVAVLWRIFGKYPFHGDENNIFQAAIKYSNMSGFFNYSTTYFYMISLQLIPFQWAVVIFKIILSGLVIGYIIYRLQVLTKTYYSWLIYIFIFAVLLIFLVSGKLRIDRAIDLLYNVHRMPMYAMLYLFCICKLFCDYLDNVRLDRKNFLILSVLLSILTQWRVEGIYLALMGVVLIVIAYRIKFNVKTYSLMYVVFFIVQMIVYIPQMIETNLSQDNYNNHRLTHFYNYSITNMMRNGLDEEKNGEELNIIDEYVSIEKIKEINLLYGDDAYRDEYILFYDGVRDNASEEVLLNYESAMNRIIFNNLDVFIVSQLEAFNYISCGYGLEAMLFSNLYLCFLIFLGSLVYFIIKRNYLGVAVILCMICHSAITTILLPAAYFKYYYMQYLISILFITYISCLILNKKLTYKMSKKA